MKRLALALILTCVLSVSALAGDVPTAGLVSTPPPPPPPGDISTPGVAPSGGTQSSSVLTTILLTIINLSR